MLRAERRVFCALLLLTLSAASLSADEELLATAPADIRELLKSGGVSLEIYDPATAESDVKNFHGSTVFELFLAAPYEVKFRWQPDGQWTRVSIETAFQPVEAKLTQKIKIPERRNRADFWHDPLVRHELDHVAITTDPRAVMLFERTLQSVVSLERKIQKKSQLKLGDVTAIIDEELRIRREAVFELIRKQNHKLDQETRHGAVALADRDVFFRELYEKTSLHEASFPFFTDVLGLLKEKAYRKAAAMHLGPVVGTDPAEPVEPVE